MTRRQTGGTNAKTAITGSDRGKIGMVAGSIRSEGKARAGCIWWSEWRGALSIIADEYHAGAFQLCRAPIGSGRPSGRTSRRRP